MYCYIVKDQYQVSGGSSSGKLELNRGSGDWRPICNNEFTKELADTAREYIGYSCSIDVYAYHLRYIPAMQL